MKFTGIPNRKIIINGIYVAFNDKGEYMTDNKETIDALANISWIKKKVEIKPKTDKPVTEKAKRASKNGNNVR